MPKIANQKTRIMEVKRYLLRYSDEAHPVSVADILRHLTDAGFSANRKTVMDDLRALGDDGVDVIVNRGRGGGCFIGGREFENAELKLLIDAVQFSRFIPREKSRQIISKLLSQTTVFEEKNLVREVYVAGQIKSESKDLIRTVDTVQTAIANDRKISFLYSEWTGEHTLALRHGGKRYLVSPCLLSWDSEYYYLLAWDKADATLKHFRVDKMSRVREEDAVRDGREEWEKIVADPAKYENMLFGMHSGEEANVLLSVDKSLAGIIIDRFGCDLPFLSDGPGAPTFRISVHVVVSPVFLSWVIGFGEKMAILSPDWVRLDALALADGFVSVNRNEEPDLPEESEPEPETDPVPDVEGVAQNDTTNTNETSEVTK